MQLHGLILSNNKLEGSLPETWSKLTNVSLAIELTSHAIHVVCPLPQVGRFQQHRLQERSINSMHNTDLAWHLLAVLCSSVPSLNVRRALSTWLAFQ